MTQIKKILVLGVNPRTLSAHQAAKKGRAHQVERRKVNAALKHKINRGNGVAWRNMMKHHEHINA